MKASPLLILPGLVCLFWAGAHWFLASRTSTFGIFFMLMLTVFFTIAGDVLLWPLLDSNAIAHIFIYTFAPAIIPLTCLYYHHLYKPFAYLPRYLLWIVLPAVLGTTSLILTLVIGLDGTEELLRRIHAGHFNPNAPDVTSLESLYYYWTIVLFRGVIIAEFIFFTIYSGVLTHRFHMGPRNSHRFLFKREPIRLLEMQMVLACMITITISLKLILHNNLFHENRYWAYSIASFQAVLFFFFGMFALFGSKEYIYLRDIQTLLRFNYSPETQSAVSEEIITDLSGNLTGESLTRVISLLGTQHGSVPARGSGGKSAGAPSLASAVLNFVSLTQDETGIAGRFQKLMQQERLYLQPGLTLADVAERLNTNKTYISKMVNQTYKMGFPELLNILRVDYAQRYIRSHADASQEEIAKASGFLSASAFNSTFKRITGFTPKVWTARKDSAGR